VIQFSVIIATFRRPSMLAETLESVLACDPPPLEVLVVDGDSGRSAESVASTFAARSGPVLRYLSTRRGLTRQRNDGLAAATGDVVIFLDDDVTVPADTFRVLADAFNDRAVVGATARILGNRSRLVAPESRLRRFLPGGGTEGAFTRYGYPRYVHHVDRPRDIEYMPGCFMCSRRVDAAAVGFDEALTGYALAEDEDFSYRLARRGRIRYLPQLVVEHRLAPHTDVSPRALARSLVVNRTFLFHKNFVRTPLARLQFAGLIVLLGVHRLLARDPQGVRGIAEGAAAVLREGRAPADPGEPRVVGIAFVSSHARLGGSERYLEWLINAIEPEYVRAVVSLEEGSLPDRSRELGHPTSVIPTSNRKVHVLAAARRLRVVLLRANPDIVHANGVKAAIVASIATLGTGIPVVWLKFDFSMDGIVAGIVARRCAQIIGVSEAVTRTFGPRVRRKVHVVYTGIPPFDVDREQARALVLREFASPPEHVVTLVGRLDPDKGHAELLEAAPAIIADRPRTGFLFVGGGNPEATGYGRSLTTRLSELGLDGRVRFLSHRPDATSLMAGSDLLTHVSVLTHGVPDTEGFPLVALESMLGGTPVVGYANGGLPELVGDCGRLIPRGDRRALVRAILDLLEDDALRRRLGSCGRERVQQRFLLDTNVEEMKERYRAAARERRHA